MQRKEIDERASREGLCISHVLGGGPSVFFTPNGQGLHLHTEKNQTIMGIAIPIPMGELSASQPDTESTNTQASLERPQEGGSVSAPRGPHPVGAVSHDSASADGCSASTHPSLKWRVAVKSRTDETGSNQKFLREWPVGGILQLDEMEEYLLNPKRGGLCQIVVWYKVENLEGANQGGGEA